MTDAHLAFMMSLRSAPAFRSACEGLQQAKDYAIMLGLKFAYATYGQEVVEFHVLTGLERTRADYPTPDDLWAATGRRPA